MASPIRVDYFPMSSESVNVDPPKMTFDRCSQENTVATIRTDPTFTTGLPPDEKIRRTFIGILVSFFCFPPTGIVAVIKASIIQNRLDDGDIEGAYEASESARLWTFITIFLGMTTITLIFALAFLYGL